MTGRTGRRSPLRSIAMVVAAAVFAAATPAFAQPGPVTAIEAAIADRVDGDYARFYQARAWQPLWLEPSGRIGPEAGILLRKLDTAQFDGLNPRQFRTDRLAKRLARAQRGGPEDRARAEEELSKAFVDYVRATRRTYDPQIHYTSPLLPPAQPSPRSALEAAASAPSLGTYISEMRWLHPLYAPMRDAMQERGYSESQRQAMWSSMARLRGIPPRDEGRYVLVDAAGAKLTMYEDGKPVDSMRVVVGKEANPTPLMAGLLQYAIVNPYWNIPPDLVQHNIAANVVDRGLPYLKQRGYEVLDGWGDDAALLDPRTIDWQAVASGSSPAPRVRQKPGGDNFMGRVKFMFPNELGIYLHDTPDKGLLKSDARQLSSGCVRLEDADRLGKWLMREKLPAKVKEPEKVLNMPELVPVYITYLTARPEKGKIVFQEDVYSRDGAPRFAAR